MSMVAPRARVALAFGRRAVSVTLRMIPASTVQRIGGQLTEDLAVRAGKVRAFGGINLPRGLDDRKLSKLQQRREEFCQRDCRRR